MKTMKCLIFLIALTLFLFTGVACQDNVDRGPVPIVQAYNIHCFNALRQYFHGHEMVSLISIHGDTFYIGPFYNGQNGVVGAVAYAIQWYEMGGAGYLDAYNSSRVTPLSAGHFFHQKILTSVNGFKFSIHSRACHLN